MAVTGVIGSLVNQISPGSVVTIGLALFLLYVILEFQTSLSYSLPLINGRKPFEFSNANAKERYKKNAKELLELGFKKVRCHSGEKPSRIRPNEATTNRR
jgi:flagellar biosynthesis protein FliP